MRVIVIGAGPAGMTAALELSRGGADVSLYEASDRVGGLARSFDLWGQTVDLGAHRFFSTDARVNRLWLGVVGRDYRMVDRVSHIYYQNRFFAYPLRPVNALRNMGPINAALCLGSYLKQRVAPGRSPDTEGTFESWVVDRFGRRLFEMFFKHFSEKLWGIPCSELNADFAAQRIKKFSLGEAVRGAFSRWSADKSTLTDRFAYPLAGTGSVYLKMAEEIQSAGGRIHLSSPARRVVRDGERITGVEFVDGQIEPCDHVISTMPLTLLVAGLGDIPADVKQSVDSLRFRNTIVVYLNVDSPDLFPDQWLYIHSPDLMTGRVTNFRNWVPELYGEQTSTILAVEYWCNNDDPLWSEPPEQSIDRATREMRSTGLLKGAEVLGGHVVRIPRCYPVYTRDYRGHVDRIVAYLRRFRNLTPIGRYGAFKYNNQDHSILMGILAAENILADGNHDLWAVNSDYDSYQEEALITETGLVRATGRSLDPA